MVTCNCAYLSHLSVVYLVTGNIALQYDTSPWTLVTMLRHLTRLLSAVTLYCPVTNVCGFPWSLVTVLNSYTCPFSPITVSFPLTIVRGFLWSLITVLTYHTCPWLFVVTGKFALPYETSLWSVLTMFCSLTVLVVILNYVLQSHTCRFSPITMSFPLTIVRGFPCSLVTVLTFLTLVCACLWSLVCLLCNVKLLRGHG